MKQLFEAPKKLRTLLISMVALLAGNALTSCSNDDELQVAPEGQKGYVEFSLSRGADTRTAYSFNEETSGLDATWSEGDKVVVESVSGDIYEVFDLVSGAGAKTAKFAKENSQFVGQSGYVNIEYAPGFKSGMSPKEYFLDLSSQEGNLEDLGKYDLFVFTATLDNGKILNPTFQPVMSILHFPKDFNLGITATTADLVFSGGYNKYGPSVTDKEGDITIKDVSLTEGKLSNDIYVSVYSANSGTVPTSLTVGGKTFALPEIEAAGKIYNLAESDLMEMNKEPLTLEAIDAGKITIKNPLKKTIQYRINGGDKVTITGETEFEVKQGDKVQFFSTNASLSNSDGSSYTQIDCSADCYVYGNVMSLIDDGTDGYDADKVIDGRYALCKLFEFNTHIRNHDKMALILPATKLANFCYEHMFFGCTGLTTAPALPATKLAESCYSAMFFSCTRLTTAPMLPATTLAHYCYYSMFSDCISLTKAPELPATELAEGCYYCMFSGCISLKDVTCLATDISATDCTYEWLDGVASDGTFTKASEMTSWTSGVNGIPAGWDIDNY